MVPLRQVSVNLTDEGWDGPRLHPPTSLLARDVNFFFSYNSLPTIH